MLLHHVTTCCLLFCMIYSNQLGIGCLVAFLHDVSDILALLTKAFTHTPYDNILAVSFVSMMAVWFYTRNIVLTYLVYKSAEDYGYKGQWAVYQPCVNISISMLGALVFLQWYWMSLFAKMLYGFATQGATEDIQNKVEDQRTSNKSKVK